jgi:predicted O-methyltransferase YrrM
MADIRHLSQHLGFQLAGRLSLRRLKPDSRFDHVVAASVARALQSDIEADEQLWREGIERLRRKLSRDDTVLRYSDYGQTRPETGTPQVVARTIGEVQGSAVPPHHGLTLHVLVRDTRPSSCLELGTCLGISAAYIASALDVNGHGRLTTLEGGKDLSRVASINFSRIGLANTRFVTGQFLDVLPDVLPQLEPVDFAHVDGHHDGVATQRYFEMILQHLAPRSVIVFDDIRWSRDMRDAWRKIRSHPCVTRSLDLFTFGVCVMNPTGNPAPGESHHAQT